MRFKVFSVNAPEVAELLAPYHTCGIVNDDFGYVLVECDDTDKPIRYVGGDGGEPEDQLLVRDWVWVAVELNALADENDYLQSMVKRLTAYESENNNDKLECGCSNNEFGCQGYHGA